MLWLNPISTTICRLVTLAYPSAEVLLVPHVGNETFINALSDSALQLEVMKHEPETIEAALSHAIKLEVYGQSLSLHSVTVNHDDGCATHQPRTVCAVVNRSVRGG